MNFNMLNKRFLIFALKFIVLYCFFYFASLAVIGLASLEGYYVAWVHDYFNAVQWLKNSLIIAVEFISNLLGHKTVIEGNELIRFENARGVRIAKSCLGIGVMSFWAAFIISDHNYRIKKTYWLLLGLMVLWMINVLRIVLFLFSINLGWEMPFGLDHHTWFNIQAYLAIFMMIYFYEKSST